jgi:hypothetical protein
MRRRRHLDVSLRPMAIRHVTLAAAVSLLLAAARVEGHHHVGCVYDTAALRTLTGKVVEIDWKFPHVHVRIDAPDRAPGGVTWDIETVNPQGLRRGGIERDTLRVGDVLAATVWIAKDGSSRAFTRSMTLATGKVAAFPVADLSCPV